MAARLSTLVDCEWPQHKQHDNDEEQGGWPVHDCLKIVLCGWIEMNVGFFKGVTMVGLLKECIDVEKTICFCGIEGETEV